MTARELASVQNLMLTLGRKTALKVLAGGGVLGFFPEGHRSETGTMIKAHPGIAGIALRMVAHQLSFAGRLKLVAVIAIAATRAAKAPKATTPKTSRRYARTPASAARASAPAATEARRIGLSAAGATTRTSVTAAAPTAPMAAMCCHGVPAMNRTARVTTP